MTDNDPSLPLLCTKKELAALASISPRTTYRTLKAIGLDTSKRVYANDEIQQFLLARHLLNRGRTLRQVADYFQHYASLKTIDLEQPS